MVFFHEFSQQVDGTLELLSVGIALSESYLGIHIVTGHIDSRRSASFANELPHTFLGILGALHILGLIDEQVDACAVVLNELAGRQARGIHLAQRQAGLVHQASGGENVRQVQTALVEEGLVTHRHSEVDALADVGIGRIILIGRVFLIEPPQRGIASRCRRLAGQVGLHPGETGFLLGHYRRLRGNQVVQALESIGRQRPSNMNNAHCHHRQYHKSPHIDSPKGRSLIT